MLRLWPSYTARAKSVFWEALLVHSSSLPVPEQYCRQLAYQTLRGAAWNTVDADVSVTVQGGHASCVCCLYVAGVLLVNTLMYVYLVEAVGTGLVKIGTATRPKLRLFSLACGSPVPLVLLGMFEGDRKTERAVHGLFATLRAHHEWFHDRNIIRVYFAQQPTWRLTEPKCPAKPRRRPPAVQYAYVPMTQVRETT